MTDKISEFRGPTRYLSNFEPSLLEYEGILYPTVEHAYQSAKTNNLVERKRISELSSPGDAKRAGQKLTIRPDWESVKLSIMETLVLQKFTNHPHLKEKLLATGDTLLEEGNHWNDRWWGICPKDSSNGQNHLGKILMKVRDELNLMKSKGR